MKKIKKLMAAASVFILFATPTSYADGFAPAEGLYIGGLFAAGSGIVQPRVQTSNEAARGQSGSASAGVFETTEGGLGLTGIEGGAVVGYGYKMGDLYAGLEGEWLASDVEFKLTSSVAIDLNRNSAGIVRTDETLSEISAKKTWTGGAFGRLGYYINSNTLFSAKGGVLVSEFDVAYSGSDSQAETYYAGGPAFGLSMDSSIAAIDPNLNLRIGAVYTDFLTASVQGIGTESGGGDVNSEVTGEGLSARVGLTYSFFDASSLF